MRKKTLAVLALSTAIIVSGKPAPAQSTQPYAQAPAPKVTEVPTKVVTGTLERDGTTTHVKDSVPIYLTNGGTIVMVDVLLGGQPLRMLIDTGATTCSITKAVATRIVRDGHGTWEKAMEVQLADGSTRTVPVLLIRELQIGQHVVRNVRASVSSGDDMLLAFPVVNGIAPFTIDTRIGELIFHTNG